MALGYFANWQDITAQINHITNRLAAGVFSHLGDTGESADKRYTDAAVNDARRKAAYRIFEAIGSNPSHPYWGILKTDVDFGYGDPIPPYYGEIGEPLISPSAGLEARTGFPADPDEIESYRGDIAGTFSNLYGAAAQEHDELTDDDVISPLSLLYSTNNGVIIFTGYECTIPMIVVPQGLTSPEADTTAAEYMADTKMPIPLSTLNAKLALPGLVKEGDNLFRVAMYLGEQAERELTILKGGAVKVAPIDVGKAIQVSQRVS